MTIHITPRELEVWKLTAIGLPVKVICSRIGICRDTLWRYRQNVMEHLHVSSPVELTLAAIANGVVKVEPSRVKLVVGRNNIHGTSKK